MEFKSEESLKFKTKKSQRKTGWVFLVLAGIVVVFTIAYSLGQNSVLCEVCPPQDLDFSLFWEVYHKLKQSYVDAGEIDDQEIIYGAIAGMLEALGDPYTSFFDPEEAKMFMENISGRFEGVGMEIGIRKNALRVIAPLEGTPAQRAGLLPGDRILKVDDVFTVDLSLDQAVSLIRGPKGTSVVLTIMRESWEEPKEITIKRAVIEVPSLKWEIKENNIVHLQLFNFSEKANFDFSQAVNLILASGAEKIILDLRNNPGGYLEVAEKIASFFLEKGDLVAIEDFGDVQSEYRARGNSVLLNYPIVILINEGTASGAEILAAALRDNRGIQLIGEESFGKGSVQQPEDLRGGALLKITIAKWLTPKGETIHEVGLEPDIRVEMSEEDYLEERDPQLERALEVIRGL